MNKSKFLVGTLVVGTMITTSFATVSAASPTKSENVEVSYDNRNEIPDPDKPENPDWVVKIPSKIAFTDDNKIIDATVELAAAGTAAGIPTNISVAVEATSANAYKLVNKDKNDAIQDKISYKLKYGEKDLSADVVEIGALTHDAPIVKGDAYLGSDKAKYRGTYSDTLTYKITKTVNP